VRRQGVEIEKYPPWIESVGQIVTYQGGTAEIVGFSCKMPLLYIRLKNGSEPLVSAFELRPKLGS
jgi:hypothetical protein